LAEDRDTKIKVTNQTSDPEDGTRMSELKSQYRPQSAPKRTGLNTSFENFLTGNTVTP